MSQYTHSPRRKESHLDPPDLPREIFSDDDTLLSNCCTAMPYNEIDEYNMAICQQCGEWALFTDGSEDED